MRVSKSKRGYNHRGPLPQRFWSRVCKEGPKHPVHGTCWVWIGALKTDGYGSVIVDGKTQSTHRTSWYLTFGQWPDKFVCHKCDNKRCVNPAHLFLGDAKDNATDLVKKRLHLFGSRHGRSRLTETDIPIIRTSKEPASIVAKRYGVSEETVYDIRRHRTWRHVK